MRHDGILGPLRFAQHIFMVMAGDFLRRTGLRRKRVIKEG
jgi:hypothetical protein